MNKVNVFISYANDDRPKMEFIRDLINACPKLNALVVPEMNSDLEYSPEKIKDALSKAKVFLPILTSNSIYNQWVNQEIGYVFGSSRIKTADIKPIIEKNISSKLKGFISMSNNLDYRFIDEENFKEVAKKLVDNLNDKYKNTGNYNVYFR